jgi:hypothetical protein
MLMKDPFRKGGQVMNDVTRKLRQVAGLGLAVVAMMMMLNVGQAAAARSVRPAGRLDLGERWLLGRLDLGERWLLGRLGSGERWVLGRLDPGERWVFKGRAANSGN